MQYLGQRQQYLAGRSFVYFLNIYQRYFRTEWGHKWLDSNVVNLVYYTRAGNLCKIQEMTKSDYKLLDHEVIFQPINQIAASRHYGRLNSLDTMDMLEEILGFRDYYMMYSTIFGLAAHYGHTNIVEWGLNQSLKSSRTIRDIGQWVYKRGHQKILVLIRKTARVYFLQYYFE